MPWNANRGGSIELILPAFLNSLGSPVCKSTPRQGGLVKEIGAFFLFMLQNVVSLELICRHKQIIFVVSLALLLVELKQSAVVKDIQLALILSSFLCVCSPKPAAS